jgi:hypothetical protein
LGTIDRFFPDTGRRHRCRARLLGACLLLATPAYPQSTENGRARVSVEEFEAIRQAKVVTAVRTTGPITLDGRLDEASWAAAVPGTDFFQKFPSNGAPATESTEFRVLYDEDNLYVGVVCVDSDPENMVVKELREDFDLSGTDRVQVVIDSLHDRRSGFSFLVNPVGAKRDSQLYNSGGINNDWDGVWDAKVTRNDTGWIIEYVIPFKTLRFSSAPIQEWGFQVSRLVLRANEETTWSPIPVRFQAIRTDLAGTLRGLEGIRQGRNLKIKPYVSAAAIQTTAGAGLRTDGDYDGGIDVKYSLTPSLTLDGTYRTDFAQVEVDQQQVNLTRFNLFFPEKRDFFLENHGIFTFGPSFGPGGGPNVTNNVVPFFSRRIGLSAAGTPIPIVGGARVSGQIDKYDVGFLTMRTEETGSTPSNTYLVGRVRRNLLRSSFIGGVVTSRDSALAGDTNRVYGTDLHFQFFEKLEFDSHLLASDTPGRSGHNQARRVQAGWIDDELVISAEYNVVQPNFNPEVGFVRRGDMSHLAGDIAWKPRFDRSATMRNLHVGATTHYYEDSRGLLETRSHEATLGLDFENGGSVSFVTTETFDRLTDPFRIRSNIAIAPGDYSYLTYSANADSGRSRKMIASGTVTWGDFWNGRNTSVTTALGWRPNHHVNIDLNYSRNDVQLPGGSFITDLVGARFLYAFTPRAFFNAFLQYNADTRQVSSNIRFDLLHRPLSNLYVVYNDRRDTLRGEPIERAVIVKLTNLFNF